MTASLDALVVKLRAAADRAKDNDVAKRLTDAAGGLQAAVDDFNPTHDVPAGLRRMVAALAVAQKVMAEFGAVLVPPVTIEPAPAAPKKARRKTDDSPPEAA